jgi:TPR repeat protein
MGYAPAQGQLSMLCFGKEAFLGAQRAASQGDRTGIFWLGWCHYDGRGCAKNERRAIELYREAAEMGHVGAQSLYGRLSFGKLEWQRYLWWGRAAADGEGTESLVGSVVDLLPSFESGKNGRILHTVAPVLREGLYVEQRSLFGVASE